MLVATELLVTLLAAVVCAYGLAVTRTLEAGACAPIRQWAQEIWAEMLAAILALLLAGRGGLGPPPPPPGGPDGPTDGKGGTAA